jgi:hypothetical protein
MRHLVCGCFLVGMLMVAVSCDHKVSISAVEGDDQSLRKRDGIASNDDQPGAREGKRSAAEAVNLRLDEKSARKIAEIVLVKVYGPEVLKERPWTLTETGDSFKFQGKLPTGDVGGVAEIEISKRNAAVTSITHGK